MTGLSVQQVADEAGVAPSTVRLYARRGLVATSRTPGNARRFDFDAPCRVAIVKAAQRAGLELAAITDLLAGLPREATEADWDRVDRRLIEEAERRIAELRDVIADVSGRAPLCASSLTPADVQARHGE